MSDNEQSPPSLPAELCESVSLYIDDADLEAWALVRKDFAANAQKRLFASIILCDGGGESTKSKGYKGGTTSSFYQLVKESPHIATYVKNLVQYGKPLDPYEKLVDGDPIMLEASGTILKATCNLKSLSINGTSHIYKLLSGDLKGSPIDVQQLLIDTSGIRCIQFNQVDIDQLQWLRFWPGVVKASIVDPIVYLNEFDRVSSDITYDRLPDNTIRSQVLDLFVATGGHTWSSFRLFSFLSGSECPLDFGNLESLFLGGTASDMRLNDRVVEKYNIFLQSTLSLKKLTVVPPLHDFMIWGDTPSLILTPLTQLEYLSVTNGFAKLLPQNSENIIPWVVEAIRSLTAPQPRQISVDFLVAPIEGSLLSLAALQDHSSWASLDHELNEKGFRKFHLRISAPSVFVSNTIIEEIRQASKDLLPITNSLQRFEVSTYDPRSDPRARLGSYGVL